MVSKGKSKRNVAAEALLLYFTAAGAFRSGAASAGRRFHRDVSKAGARPYPRLLDERNGHGDVVSLRGADLRFELQVARRLLRRQRLDQLILERPSRADLGLISLDHVFQQIFRVRVGQRLVAADDVDD